MAYPYTYEDGEDLAGSGYGNTAFSAATQGTTLADLGTYDLIGGRYGGPTQTFAAPVSNKGNPTSQISKGTNTFAVGPQTAVRLVNNATGEVVFEGVGYDAAQKARDMAQGLTDAGGRKANWDIQAATPGMSGYATVANEKANKSTLGKIGSVVGTALPIAVSLIPGLQIAALGAIGSGALAGGVGAAMAGRDPLKGALMSGLSAAGGQYIGSALRGADVGAKAASAIGTGVGSTAGGLLTGQSLKNSLLGGVASGGLSYLGGELQGALKGTPTDVGINNPGDLAYGTTGAATRGLDSLLADISGTAAANVAAAGLPTTSFGVRVPSAASTTAPPAAAPNVDPAMVVTGTRLPGPTFASVNNLFTPARYSGDGPTPSEIIVKGQKEVPAETENKSLAVVPATTTPSDIIVKGQKDVPATEDKSLAVVPTTTTPDEIIVKGQKDVPATEDKSLAVNPVVPTTTTPDEIIVKGQKDVPATEDKSLAVNPVVPTTTTPSDIIVKGQKDVPATEDKSLAVVPTTTTPDEIIVKGQKDVPATEDKPLSVNMTDIGDLINSDDFQKTVAEEEANTKKKSTTDKISDYLRLLGLGVGLIGNIGGGGGGGAGTGRYNTGKGALNPIFSAKLPTPGTEGAFTVGGLGGTAADRTFAARPDTDWYRYGMGPAMDIPAGTDMSNATSPYAGYGPGTLGEETFKQVTGMSHGGAMGYSRGSSRDSFAVEGPGTGRSDDIPAVLSDGEYVIDAETVALLGDGSSRAGAKKLDELRVKVRKHKGKNLAKGKFSVNAKHPEAYMLGGRI